MKYGYLRDMGKHFMLRAKIGGIQKVFMSLNPALDSAKKKFDFVWYTDSKGVINKIDLQKHCQNSLSPEVVQQIIELRTGGLTVREIADQLGISPSSVIKYSRRNYE